MATQKTNPVFDYVAKAAEQQAQSDQAQIDVAELMRDQESQYNEMVVQTLAGGNVKKGIISAQQSLDASVDSAKASIVENYGTDYEKQGSDVLRWSSEMKTNQAAAFEAEKQLREAQQIDFLSNPLGFISAQFSLPTLAARYNYHAGLSNTAQSNLSAITQASDAAVGAAARAAKSTSTELAIAKGEEAAAFAALQVAKIKADNAGTRITGVQNILNMSAQDLTRAFQVHSAQNADKQLAMQAENNAYQREARALARADAAEKLEAKQLQLGTLKAEMEAYNAGARRAGKLTFSDPKMFLSAYNTNKNLQEFTNVLTAGKLIQLNGGITNGIMVADNAGEAAVIYATGQASNPVAKFLKEVVLSEKQSPSAPKDKQAFIGAVNVRATAEAAKALKSIDTSSATGNIYAAPPASLVLQAKSTNTPFITSAIRPLVEANPNAKLTDEVIVNAAVEYAKTNKGNFNDAASSIVSYYTVAKGLNNSTNQYVENGLPEQTNYSARIGGKLFDLTDPVQVKRLLLTRSAPTIGIFSAQNLVAN